MKNGSSQSSDYDFFSKNLYTNNGKEITAEFLRNARLLKNRANGNYLFHEVISLTKSKQLTLEQEKERLFDIVRYYAEKRCDNNLVTGFLHDEKINNIHFHLMISSNEIGAYKNQRLTKFEFDKLKKETEKYVIDKYPELEQDIIINWQKNSKKKFQQKAKQSNKAGEIQRKGGRLAKKEKITSTLKDIFAQSHSKDEFFNHLSAKNIELYNRGNTVGFINGSDNKKYRLKTLALESEFQRVSDLMAAVKNTEEKSTAKGKDTMVQQQSEPKTEQTQSNDPQNEIDNRKAEIKKSRASSQEKQHDKSKSKGKDFER
jgi:hypothetical protein